MNSKNFFIKLFVNITCGLLLFYPTIDILRAQTTDCLNGCDLPNLGAFSSITEFLDLAAWFIARLAFPVAGAALIWTGIRFLLARGNESELRSAKEHFGWAIVGAFVALGAYVFVNTIKRVIETFAP